MIDSSQDRRNVLRRSAGTIWHQRVQQPWPEDRPFRILSIDGGGIRGIYPAKFLAEIERRHQAEGSIGRYFDLITGTSTGGIIALGLGYGLSAGDISQLYLDEGDKIFPVDSFPVRVLRSAKQWVRSAYGSGPLNEQLENIFGGALLGDTKTRLCIPAFEGVHAEPWVYKTPHHPDYENDQHELLVNVALATSAAPTFLPALQNNGYTMVDGGLLANNPIMVGAIDALACYQLSRRQVQVLSIGCGGSGFRVSHKMRRGGLWQWKKAISASIDAVSHNILGQARLLLGADNILRVDLPDSIKPIGLSDFQRARNELPQIAEMKAVDLFPEVAERFLVSPTNYKPITI
ncbi:CBASS cGAMP-activated phospholipase [Spectribacter hydrogenoxidans]|uniref:CBASS cGAMP-activated phospholipase n=1 Tax=Spectribacter hydrogenoxidans TaxID=3075608 RepID=A0ABU3BZW0_9GAMM|nr:CBASS cGAMP-activated phospholipase [Salinisphaera sp. W335]MDT0634845.1 CBASS cGAMP-activated phospholipase [Salinisphaera sp. W335]